MINYGHNIKFDNPIFHEGINLTCRSGSTWARKLNLEDSLFYEKTYIGSVVGISLLKFSQIHESMLHFEHDPKCRTVEGLRSELERIYGPFKPHYYVTLIYFSK